MAQSKKPLTALTDQSNLVASPVDDGGDDVDFAYALLAGAPLPVLRGADQIEG